MRVSVIEGIFNALSLSFGDGFFVTFALQAKASNSQLAALVYCPAISGALCMLTSNFWVITLGSRRRVLYVSAALQTWVYLPLALAAATNEETPFLIIVCSTLSATLGAVGAPPWSSWMNDIVPVASRGRYFGWRILICGLSGTFATSVAATALHLFTYAYVVLFLGAAVMRVLSGVLLFLQPSTSKLKNNSADAPLVHKTYRPDVWAFTSVMSILSLASGVAAPFFAPFVITTLGFGTDIFAASVTVHMASRIIANPVWGMVIDKLGSLCAFRIALFALAVSSFFLGVLRKQLMGACRCTDCCGVDYKWN